MNVYRVERRAVVDGSTSKYDWATAYFDARADGSDSTNGAAIPAPETYYEDEIEAVVAAAALSDAARGDYSTRYEYRVVQCTLIPGPVLDRTPNTAP